MKTPLIAKLAVATLLSASPLLGQGISVSKNNDTATVTYQGKTVWTGATQGIPVGRSANINGTEYAAAFDGDQVLWENTPGAGEKIKSGASMGTGLDQNKFLEQHQKMVEEQRKMMEEFVKQFQNSHGNINPGNMNQGNLALIPSDKTNSPGVIIRTNGFSRSGGSSGGSSSGSSRILSSGSSMGSGGGSSGGSSGGMSMGSGGGSSGGSSGGFGNGMNGGFNNGAMGNLSRLPTPVLGGGSNIAITRDTTGGQSGGMSGGGGGATATGTGSTLTISTGDATLKRVNNNTQLIWKGQTFDVGITKGRLTMKSASQNGTDYMVVYDDDRVAWENVPGAAGNIK